MSFAGGFSFHGRPAAGKQQWRPGADAPKMTVELTLQATGLDDKDVLSKSDPLCILYVQDAKTKQYAEFGRTETIMNTLNPKWAKTFQLEYRFEERQLLKFVIIDLDSTSNVVQDHDSLGFCEVSLGEIVAGQSRGFSKQLFNKKGFLKIFSVEVKGANTLYSLTFSAKGLDNKDFFGKSDPFLEINQVLNGNLMGPLVHRTEHINNDLNPKWKPFAFNSTKLNNDEKALLVFSVFDHDDNGKHDLIGTAHMSMEELLSAEQSNFPLINEKKKAKHKSKYKDSGVLILNSVHVEKFFSFLDFIQGGLQLNFTIAVDFTGSNGNPRDQKSLHYYQPGYDNQYTLALRSVGEIVQDYDYDKQFPCLGFGARIPPNGETSHDFFLTLNPNQPFCDGLNGILAAYAQCIQSVQLFGPTNFSPVIEHVARFARRGVADQTNYFILLIITDGIITDMEVTKRTIVEASGLPMSIIIVGVGEEDFSAMEALDGDDRRLSSGVQTAERDIVQFVELRKFAANGTWNKEALSQCVLAELPSQVTTFMKKMGYKPNIN